MKKHKIIDLFAGIGGIRRGFEITGDFETVLSAEIDDHACRTYEHLFGESPKNDVSTEEFKNLVYKTKYDVLTAGFPCQSFSIAGKREGFLDKSRGTLFFDIATILKNTKPKAFLLENVANLVSHDKGKTFKVISEILTKELGYKVVGIEEDLLGNIIYKKENLIRNSKDFGIPQNRRRIYLVGFKKECFKGDFFVGKKIELPVKREKGAIYKSLSDVIEYGQDEKWFLSQRYLNTLRNHRSRHEKKKNGFGFIVLNEKGNERDFSNALLATGGSGRERNLIQDLLSENSKNDLNIRHTTTSEWAKLQGFKNYAFLNQGKDLFSFPPSVSRTQQYKQLGNSVTITVIEEIAKMISRVLNEDL